MHGRAAVGVLGSSGRVGARCVVDARLARAAPRDGDVRRSRLVRVPGLVSSLDEEYERETKEKDDRDGQGVRARILQSARERFARNERNGVAAEAHAPDGCERELFDVVLGRVLRIDDDSGHIYSTSESR